MREVFIISDLHIGGAAGNTVYERGFKLCTHSDILADFINQITAIETPVELVINGDMVDFLAEEPFEAFTENQAAACAKLQRIINREPAFFDALRRLLNNGHSLTVLTGNHDIELTLPDVRRFFERSIGAQGKKFRFITDGEAYTIGTEILIEHGDQYDVWNKVDHPALLRLRQLQSRREYLPQKLPFIPPKGSAMVKSIINPLKKQYQFIDLLKPENEAVLPILLAIEPNLRGKISTVLSLYTGWTNANDHDPPTPTNERSVEKTPKISRKLSTKLINEELKHVLGNDELKEFNRATSETTTTTEEIESATREMKAVGERGWSDTFSWASSWISLLTAKDTKNIDKRLPALLKALRVLQNDRSFEVEIETLKEYEEAAQHLIGNGYKYIIMGHTHFARRVALNDKGAVYFNCGTWADLMQFPKEIVSADAQEALQKLKEFMDNLNENKINKYVIFRPTYVHIELGDGDVVKDINLMEYEAE
jgi:UDP-2,3-diacylglucosamine pyrophosphatase LpxH